MSLLTLQSIDNAQNPSATDPAIIRNNFKDGVELRKGTEVGLVSLSINKIASFEIVDGVNDTFTWRIGNINQYNQHKVKVPAGEYTGDSLAQAIKKSLNDSTILGNFKGAWSVVFDNTKFEGDGSFTIDYGQNETPNFNTNTLEQYSGSTGLTITNNSTTSIEVDGAQNTNGIITRTEGNNIITGEKGIFANDGEVIYEVKPVKGYPLGSFLDKLITQGIIMTENNAGATRTLAMNSPTAGSPAEINGWTMVADYTNADPDEYWYYDPTDEGHFGIGNDPDLDATDPTSWNVAEVFYNENVGFLQDTTAGARYSTTPQGTGLKFSGDPEGTSLDILKAGIGYGNTKLGWVRNQLYNGRDEYPGNPDAEIKTTQPDGFDNMFEIRDNITLDGIAIDFSQLLKNRNVAFPNPNWRDESRYVFQNKTPSNWDSIAGTNPSPTAWTNFNYARDTIQLKFQVSNIVNIKVFILHDVGGDGNFEEQQMLITMAQPGNNMSSNIVEDFFPLRPCFTMVNGGRYERKQIKVGGRFDEEEITQPVGFTYKSGEAGYEELDLATPDTTADPPDNAVKLSALYLFGQILESDLVSNGGTLPDAEVPTPASRLANNIADLIGFDRFNIYPSGLTSNPTESQHKPTLIIREPNLLVELVDFNIKGFNGATGDRGKIIASIPAEELSTNTRTGTLNYFSQYPIMIDLNLVNDTIVYDLNVIIRRPNGQVADDLIQKTAITLLFKEGDESKQRRMLKEQAELLASSMSNMNQIKTDSIGMGFPKL